MNSSLQCSTIRKRVYSTNPVSEGAKQSPKGDTIPCLHHIEMCDLPQGTWGFGVGNRRSSPSLHQRS